MHGQVFVMYTTAYFYLIKVAYKGVFISRTRFPDGARFHGTLANVAAQCNQREHNVTLHSIKNIRVMSIDKAPSNCPRCIVLCTRAVRKV